MPTHMLDTVMPSEKTQLHTRQDTPDDRVVDIFMMFETLLNVACNKQHQLAILFGFW